MLFCEGLDFLWVLKKEKSVPYSGFLACDHGNSFICLEE